MKKDISSMDDIKLLVDTFYGKIQQDNLIGGIFFEVIKDWPPHLEKMYRFWQTLLLDEITYMGNSFEPHKDFPINQTHFDRWLELWRATVNELFEGEIANKAIKRAENIAMIFASKIEYNRSQQAKS